MALTRSAPSGLGGAQEPRYRVVPPAVSSAGGEAVDLAKASGQVLDPWQVLVLDGALGELADGSWAARRVGLVVPRQNGKGGVLEAKALHSLFLTPAKLILWSAHEFKTASEAYLRLKGLIEANSELSRRVRKMYDAHGEEGVALKDGTRLRFVARSRGSGRGFSPDEVILDEAMVLQDAALSALRPALSARPNPQMWYVGSAPLDDSTVLRRICKLGRSGGSDSLAYYEWSAALGADNDDWLAVARSNPGFGIRLSPESVIDDQEDMSDADFARERLGLWYEDDEDVILPGWGALADQSSSVDGAVCFAVDAAPLGKHAAIAVAGNRLDGHLHVEITGDGAGNLDSRPGMSWVVDRVVELTRSHQACAVVLDPAGPAGSLLPALAAAGVEVVSMTARETAQAYGLVYDAVVERSIHHLGQLPVAEALRGATRRVLADAYALDRKNSGVNIAPLVAVTLAAYGFSVHGSNAHYNVLESVW